MRLLCAALLAGLLALPSASAQALQPTFVIQSFASPGLLEGDAQEMPVPWAYSFNSPVAGLLAGGQHTILLWEQPLCDKPGVVVAGPLEERLDFPLAGAQSTFEGITPFTVAALPGAPGETPIACRLAGHASAVNPLIGPSTESWGLFTVAVPYAGTVAATARQPVQILAAGTHATFSLDVANRANAASAISFELASPLPAGWSIVLPAAFVLESEAQGGTQSNGTAGVLVMAPRGASGTVPIQVCVLAGSLRDTSRQATPTVVEFLAQILDAPSVASASLAGDTAATRGKLAPDAGPLLALGLLGLAAFGRRRD